MPGDRRAPAGSRYVVAVLLTLTALGCGPAAESALLSQFFSASRLRDLTALAKVSTVVFEPASDGIVTEFEIQMVRQRAGSKEVWLTAPVRLPDGRTVTKDFAVTIQGGLVTGISERPAAASTPRP
jgi:hypothetical protein